MAVTSDLDRFLRRTLEAYTDYYRSVGRLTSNYARAFAGTASELRQNAPARAQAARLRPAKTARTTMALEAVAGSTAVGMFVVDNSGSSRVSGAIELTKLSDTDGHQVILALNFEPGRITLEPGEQTVVQATARIDHSLREEVDYRGEVSVPGPPGTTVPIVVRRLPSGRRRAATGMR